MKFGAVPGASNADGLGSAVLHVTLNSVSTATRLAFSPFSNFLGSKARFHCAKSRLIFHVKSVVSEDALSFCLKVVPARLGSNLDIIDA